MNTILKGLALYIGLGCILDDPSHYCCTQGTDTKLEAKTRIPKLFVKSLLENVFR